MELYIAYLSLLTYLVSGVDVYLRLPRLGTNLENIEI